MCQIYNTVFKKEAFGEGYQQSVAKVVIKEGKGFIICKVMAEWFCKAM